MEQYFKKEICVCRAPRQKGKYLGSRNKQGLKAMLGWPGRGWGWGPVWYQTQEEAGTWVLAPTLGSPERRDMKVNLSPAGQWESQSLPWVGGRK